MVDVDWVRYVVHVIVVVWFLVIVNNYLLGPVKLVSLVLVLVKLVL